MNRQLRRAQEKQDKKQDRAKDARRADRKRQVSRLRAEREQRREAVVATREKQKAGGTAKSDAGTTTPKKSGRAAARDPGRFAGALAIATTVFIVLQGAMPQPIESTLDSVVKAAFYLMFGYFVTLWLSRRNNASAPLITIAAGVLLAAGSWLGTILRDVPLDVLSLLLTLPLLLAGVWLGRFIARHPVA